jgi:hypothetical protein
MAWTRLKKKVENFLCPKLRGRISFHMTTYRKSHDRDGYRCWIMVDGEQIEMGRYGDYGWRQEIRYFGVPWFATKEEEEAILRHNESIVASRGLYTSFLFFDALEAYPRLSIRAALASPHVLHQALALVDRRLGRRTFEKIRVLEDAHPLIRRFYDLRAEVEGWPRSDSIPAGPWGFPAAEDIPEIIVLGRRIPDIPYRAMKFWEKLAPEDKLAMVNEVPCWACGTETNLSDPTVDIRSDGSGGWLLVASAECPNCGETIGAYLRVPPEWGDPLDLEMSESAKDLERELKRKLEGDSEEDPDEPDRS